MKWARAADGVALEDNYDAECRYDRRPIGTMQAMDPSSLILMGSVIKTPSPALRISS